MPKRIICILLAAALLTASAFAADRPSLFIGDGVWQSDSLMPFIESDGKQLVPVSALGALGISVTLSEDVGSLLLKYGSEYLSFSLSLGKVVDEDGVVNDASLYRYGGEIYIEPYIVCEKFSFRFETAYAPDGYLSARLSDGSETESFEELLKAYTENSQTPLPYLYNPTGKTVPGTFMHPVIITPAENNVKMIVNLLGRHSATFAIEPQKLASYKDVINVIYSAGHTVAFYIDKADMADTDAFAALMDEANAWLFAFIGKTSRVYVSTEKPNDTPDIDGYVKKCCNMHLVADDLMSERVVNMTLTDSPVYGVYNFSLASDYQSRTYYTQFFKKFDSLGYLRSMPLTLSGPMQ